MSDKRMRGRDLQRPFHGVRADAPLETLRDRCAALGKALRPHQCFSHETAAELWRMPLPSRGGPLHVTAVGARGRVRRPGVVGWERPDDDLPTFLLAGVLVLAPADVWCQLSTRLSRRWLVAVGDFLISGERTDFGRRPPLCTPEMLADAVRRHGRRRGAVALKWALGMLRAPVDSPRESLLRLALIAGGLPEPEVQLEVMTAKGKRHGDLGYRSARLIIEYQGDEHRTSRSRWLSDLTRVQLLEDAGYRVILVGADDLRDGARALIARIRRALARSG
ncbi:hypothetical protein AB0269_06635 [Microbacterium sp. NPDC077644]|uniref:hypothetical protein n=1 Tax=Microbacterium sp. NPDC077644 TaxID=3155055 RepID=UPI0034500F0E